MKRCSCGLFMERWSRGCRYCRSRRYLVTRHLSGQAWAGTQVAKARQRGDLVNPKTMACVDCRGAATEYDHRDYGKPLQVEPVCRGCNARRGRAVPKKWDVSEWRRYVLRAAEQGSYLINQLLTVAPELFRSPHAAWTSQVVFNKTGRTKGR